MYYYIYILYKQLSLYCSSCLNMTTSSNAKVEKTNQYDKCRRNAFSPYSENETKAIRRTNYIITDEKRRSRLGKNVSCVHSHKIQLVEEGHFCSFIRDRILNK